MSTTEAPDRNPLTGLPGNRAVKRMIRQAAALPGQLVVYIDLTDFKPYNEVYGFAAGDTAIEGLAGVITDAASSFKETFTGHIGGDDFVCVTGEKRIEDFFSAVETGFNLLRRSLYTPGDLARGFIIGWSRAGERERFPLMGICSAAFSPNARGFKTAEEISNFATYLKDSAKLRREPGESVFLTPDDINVLNIPLEEYISDTGTGLLRKRTLIEAMGESGFAHYGSFLAGLLSRPLEPYLKKSIIYALGRLRFGPASGILSEMAVSENPHLRMRAVEALGNIGGSAQVEVIGRALSDTNPYVAEAAARAIGAAGHPAGLKYLKKVALSTRRLAIEAADARCRLGDSTVSGDLCEMLNDRNPQTRQKAAAALELIPSSRSAGFICEAVKKEANPGVRRALAVSFCRIVENISPGEAAEISGKIWGIYDSSPSSMAVFFLESLGKSGDPRAEELLTGFFQNGTKWERLSAVRGLSFLEGGWITPLLRRGLSDYSAAVRAASARALAGCGDHASLGMLRKMLKDDDAQVRKSASQGILSLIRSETQ